MLSYHDGCIVRDNSKMEKEKGLSRIRISMSTCISTSDPMMCALHIPTVPYLPYRSGHCTPERRLLERRPSRPRRTLDTEALCAAHHITDLLSAALTMASSATAALGPDVVWDFHFCTTFRKRSRVEPSVSKGSISFTNLW